MAELVTSDPIDVVSDADLIPIRKDGVPGLLHVTPAQFKDYIGAAVPVGGDTGQVLGKVSAADGDVDWIDQSGGGGGILEATDWELIDSWTYSSGVANVDFTDLEGYEELLIVGRNVTCSSGAYKAVVLSTDNGATFFTTAGDYKNLAASGVETNEAFAGYTDSSTAARSFWTHISGINIAGAPKVCKGSGNPNGILFVADLDPINAIRVYPASAGNLSGGSIYLLGRKGSISAGSPRKGVTLSLTSNKTNPGNYIMLWDAKDDVGEWADLTAQPSRITVPAGVDYIDLHCHIDCLNNNTGATFSVVIHKNAGLAGANVVAGSYLNAAFGSMIVDFSSGRIPVVAGDYFNIEFYSNDGTVDLVSGDYGCRFSCVDLTTDTAGGGSGGGGGGSLYPYVVPVAADFPGNSGDATGVTLVDTPGGVRIAGGMAGPGRPRRLLHKTMADADCSIRVLIGGYSNSLYSRMGLGIMDGVDDRYYFLQGFNLDDNNTYNNSHTQPLYYHTMGDQAALGLTGWNFWSSRIGVQWDYDKAADTIKCWACWDGWTWWDCGTLTGVAAKFPGGVTRVGLGVWVTAWGGAPEWGLTCRSFEILPLGTAFPEQFF